MVSWGAVSEFCGGRDGNSRAPHGSTAALPPGGTTHTAQDCGPATLLARATEPQTEPADPMWKGSGCALGTVWLLDPGCQAPCLLRWFLLCVWRTNPVFCSLLALPTPACPLELCLGAQEQMGFVSSLALKCPDIEKCQIKSTGGPCPPPGWPCAPGGSEPKP